jgi:hypothetical protein
MSVVRGHPEEYKLLQSSAKTVFGHQQACVASKYVCKEVLKNEAVGFTVSVCLFVYSSLRM